MNITNKIGLPEIIVRAVEKRIPSDRYSPTKLTMSPRQYWLYKRHFNEIEEDVTDHFSTLFGAGVHAYVSDFSGPNDLSEEQITVELNGIEFTGILDLFSDGIITDFKTISVWGLIYGSSDKDYEIQLNCYSYLLRKIGFTPKKLQIVYFLKDWKKSQAKYKPEYPKYPAALKEFPQWDIITQESFIMTQISFFESVKDIIDDELPKCNSEDMWEKPSVWAIMKKGRKSAIKLHETKESAESHLETLDNNHFIEERKGGRDKCTDWCSVSKWCNQYKEYLEQI